MGVCQNPECGRQLPPKTWRGRDRKWCSDRCRKRACYGGECRKCGATTNGYDGPGTASDLCGRCAPTENAIWTRVTVIAALRRFHARHGRQPVAEDFNPAQARLNGRPEAAERFYADGDYPSLTHVQNVFGSWSAALRACGWEPGRPGRKPTREKVAA